MFKPFLFSILRAHWLTWVVFAPCLALAQSNDQGQLGVKGQITLQSCAFVMSESNNINNDTNASLTLKLGNIPLTTVQNTAVGSTFGVAKTVYFFTKTSAANSSSCQGGPVFDVGLTLPPNKVLTTNAQSFLLSNGSVDTGAAGGVALSLKANQITFNAGDQQASTPLDLTVGSPFGVLLSGKNNLTDPLSGLGNTRVYALTVQLAKTSADVSAGAYSSAITVNMWWR